MKLTVSHIEWHITDEDFYKKFGTTRNNIPYTTKLLGLPDYDDSIVLNLEIVQKPRSNVFKKVQKALFDKYGFKANRFNYVIS